MSRKSTLGLPIATGGGGNLVPCACLAVDNLIVNSSFVHGTLIACFFARPLYQPLYQTPRKSASSW
jgi:hypothetical protein